MAIATPEEQAKRGLKIANGLGMLVMAIPFFGDFISIGMALKHIVLAISRSNRVLADILRIVVYESFFLAAFVVPFMLFYRDYSNFTIYLFMVAPLKIVICNLWFKDIDTRLELKATRRNLQVLANTAHRAFNNDKIL